MFHGQTSLQEKQHQFEAAADAAESEFKELFAKSGFNATKLVNDAMNKKVANKDMASEVERAVRKWKYRPAMKANQPLKVILQQQFDFKP